MLLLWSKQLQDLPAKAGRALKVAHPLIPIRLAAKVLVINEFTPQHC